MPLLKLDDTELYYELHGQGPAILFFNVRALDHQAWKFACVDEFSKDHQVLVWDYRGTGKSSKAIQQYTLKMFADDAAKLVEHLHLERLIIVGHSMGGLVAQLFALDYPHCVRKLILLSSNAKPSGSHGQQRHHHIGVIAFSLFHCC
jgi:3-oxoadipate enol-lactonase